MRTFIEHFQKLLLLQESLKIILYNLYKKGKENSYTQIHIYKNTVLIFNPEFLMKQ